MRLDLEAKTALRFGTLFTTPVWLLKDTLAFHHMVGALLPASGVHVGKHMVMKERVFVVFTRCFYLYQFKKNAFNNNKYISRI